jgi:hypothetical protein
MGYPFDHEPEKKRQGLTGCGWALLVLVLVLIAVAVIIAGVCGSFS